MYEVIDWPVIVLLGCGVAHVGGAGGDRRSGNSGGICGNPIGKPRAHLGLAIIFLLSMTLSDVMNNVATAAVMAPISVSVAQSLGAPPDFPDGCRGFGELCFLDPHWAQKQSAGHGAWRL